ncbi:hypothetical protein [Terriglobus roseus]|uniref:Uncharacterized protein n=1 Tax=Terriglobus roseus TaxID=392734 RepID=A0A1G7QED1_9BACT|nr:hypothetical protein [Terriglobus roseus]SDF96901.1 hypothetical protein SAMN05444167_3847 [Terriglobus roseus]
MASSLPVIDSQNDLHSLVQAFEAGSLPKAAWTHAAHVAVGANYVSLHGEPLALETMRRRVRAYNESVGTVNSDTSGYHETLTRFWIAVLARLHEEEKAASHLMFVQRAVTLYGGRRDLHQRFYNFDVVKNTEARQAWVAPDHWPTCGIIS